MRVLSRNFEVKRTLTLTSVNRWMMILISGDMLDTGDCYYSFSGDPVLSTYTILNQMAM